MRRYSRIIDRPGWSCGRGRARRAGSSASSRSRSATAKGCARPPSASRRSTATRTCTRSASTAGSTWRSRARGRCRSSSASTSAGRLDAVPEHRAVPQRAEIGWTWLERAHWGTGANVETKYLLLGTRSSSWGAMRVEFKTDARNLRVRGALLGVGGDVRGDLPQAHGAAGLDPRLGLVRDRRRRLAAGRQMLEAKIEKPPI